MAIVRDIFDNQPYVYMDKTGAVILARVCECGDVVALGAQCHCGRTVSLDQQLAEQLSKMVTALIRIAQGDIEPRKVAAEAVAWTAPALQPEWLNITVPRDSYST